MSESCAVDIDLGSNPEDDAREADCDMGLDSRSDREKALEGELRGAMRTAVEDPRAAEARLRRLRRSAMRHGLKALATSCLVQLRLVVGLFGDWKRELRILRQIIREDFHPIHLVSLAGALERQGRLRDAEGVYRQALARMSGSERREDTYRNAREGLRRIETGRRYPERY